MGGWVGAEQEASLAVSRGQVTHASLAPVGIHHSNGNMPSWKNCAHGVTGLCVASTLPLTL